MDETQNGYMPEFYSDDKKANGLRAFETLGQFLKEDGWSPQQLDDKYVYRTHYYGKHAEFRCYAQVRIDFQQFIFYAVAAFRIEEEMRPMVAEYITRANYGLRIGNFEMDYTDGEVRYKCGLDFEGEVLSANLIKYMVYPSVQTMDRYMPGLMKVAFGGKAPVDAIVEIEEG